VILHPVFLLLSALVGFLGDTFGNLADLIPQLDAIVLPWPVPWLPYEPILSGLAFAVAVSVSALVAKFARWLYGMVPVAQ
jgi:hypothetical protein